MTSSFTIILPAHNEGIPLRRTAPALKRAVRGLGARVIYVLNATTDDSARVIEDVFGDQAQIIMRSTLGKTGALNAGDRASGGGVTFYLDADVMVAPGLFEALLNVLHNGTADLVAPRLRVDFEGGGPVARRVGRVWADQMARRKDAFMCCTGFSAAGRQQRGEWPDVLADDDWARSTIAPARRKIVETAQAQIRAPRSLASWLNVRARWIRGSRALSRQGIAQSRSQRVPPKGSLPDLAAYYAVRLAAEPLAVIHHITAVPWARDKSARHL